MPSRSTFLRGLGAGVVAFATAYLQSLLDSLIDQSARSMGYNSVFQWTSRNILQDTYIDGFDKDQGKEFKFAVAQDLFDPVLNGITVSVAVAVVGLCLWLAYGALFAHPRGPLEVPRYFRIWLSGLVALTSVGAVLTFVIGLYEAQLLGMIRVQALLWGVAVGGALPALLFVLGSYLLTPSLLRPALPGAWLFGR